MSACLAYWPDSLRAEYKAIIGGKLSVIDREARDDIQYQAAIQHGECLYDQRNVPDFGEFLETCIGEWGTPRKVALYSYRKANTEETLKNVGFGDSRIEWVVSGPKGLDPDIRGTRRLVRLGRIKLPQPSLLMASNIAASVVERSKYGNLIMTKSGKHSRIDLCSAMILAVGLADRQPVSGQLRVY